MSARADTWVRPYIHSRLSRGRGSRRHPRRYVRDDVHEIFFGELRDNRLHQVGPLAVSRAHLHVEHLTREIARGTSGDPGHRPDTLQIGAVAHAAVERATLRE